MCDEATLADDIATISRRRFGTLAGAAVVASGCSGTAVIAASKKRLVEATVNVTTPDGTADCFFVHPVKGKHPGVILWPDIGGLRDSFKEMARRLASEGYAVLAVNQFYRGGKAPVLTSFAEWRTPEGKAKLAPMIAQINAEGITRDAKAFVVFLDKQKAVNTRRGIGSQGYCMGGPFTVRTAAAAPNRVRAAASFHGGGLVGDKPDSPQNLLAVTKASYLIAVARGDDTRAPTDKDMFRAAAAAAGRTAEIEVYAAEHGWTVPDSPVYDKPEAERAWTRLLALYSKL